MLAIQLALQTQRVIHHDFAGQKDHCEFIAEVPLRDRVVERIGHLLAALQTLQPFLRVIADDAGVRAARQPLVAREMRTIRKLNLLRARGETAFQRREGQAEQPLHLRADLPSILFGERQSTIRASTRRRIGICAATNRHQRHRAGRFAFDRFLRVARPIAADVVDLAAQRRAMTGIIRHEREQPAVGALSLQHGQRMIHRATLRPSVRRKSNGARRPAQLSRPTVLQRVQRNSLQVFDERNRVAVDGSLLFRRQIAHENVRRPLCRRRPAVRVRARDDNAVGANLRRLRQPAPHLAPRLLGDAAVIERDQDGRPFAVAANGERLHPQLLLHASMRSLA